MEVIPSEDIVGEDEHNLWRELRRFHSASP